MTAQHPVVGTPRHFIQIAQQHDVGHGSGQIRAQHKGFIALRQAPLWMPSQGPLHTVQSLFQKTGRLCIHQLQELFGCT